VAHPRPRCLRRTRHINVDHHPCRSRTIDKDDPQDPAHDRFTAKRFEKALNVTLNSVIFRSSGQDLTTTGTYITMGSRLLEPALLALAVLAVRGRIKR
jgi:hypothetical protein